MKSFKNEYIDLIMSKLPDILVALIVLIIFWIIAQLLNKTISKILNKHTSSSIPDVIGSIIKRTIIVIGFITSLGTLGVNVSGIIAGLGISGVALSLALKDILSNFVSGVLIFIYEPFKVGDNIEVEGKTGKVKSINLRYVTIESEQKDILVPNLISASKIVTINK
tara:strand:+ start:488 stop:985 length:498 start_codon:yes stop_codon:yes gene_type:complete